MQVFHIAGSWHEGINFQSTACTVHKLMPEEISVVTSSAVQRSLSGREGQGRQEEGVRKGCVSQLMDGGTAVMV